MIVHLQPAALVLSAHVRQQDTSGQRTIATQLCDRRSDFAMRCAFTGSGQFQFSRSSSAAVNVYSRERPPVVHVNTCCANSHSSKGLTLHFHTKGTVAHVL